MCFGCMVIDMMVSSGLGIETVLTHVGWCEYQAWSSVSCSCELSSLILQLSPEFIYLAVQILYA